MTYFKMNNMNFSHCVNSLEVIKNANYNAQTNAAGDTVVDYINHKRTLKVGIIPLTNDAMVSIQSVIRNLNVTVSYRDPYTGELETCNCIIPENGVQYYTIRADKVMYQAFTLTFIEL